MKITDSTYCSMRDAAKIIGLSYPCIRQWHLNGVFPKAKRFGKLVFLDRSEVEHIAEHGFLDPVKKAA